MKSKIQMTFVLIAVFSFYLVSCQKDSQAPKVSDMQIASEAANGASPPFNIEVILRSDGKAFGHVKFRQDVDPTKIITLDTWVRDLEPNHSYSLQRAVDAINEVDGNCTSVGWLTLGKGLVAQAILTNDKGTGREELWRDVTAVASGSAFDIHFRVIDATTGAVVLTSDCYKYVVR